MSKPMTFQELVDVMKFIAQNNSPFSPCRGPGGEQLPVVKYAYPSLDFRFNNVFALTLAGFGSEITFHCQNECRDMAWTLKERVMYYLTGQQLIEDQALRQMGEALRLALKANTEFYWVQSHNRAEYVK